MDFRFLGLRSAVLFSSRNFVSPGGTDIVVPSNNTPDAAIQLISQFATRDKEERGRTQAKRGGDISTIVNEDSLLPAH